MRSPGITVRPLKQMTGESAFNEIFFSNVRVPVENVLGEIDRGWQTAIATLMNERANLGTGSYVLFKRNLDALIARSRTVKSGDKTASKDPVA